MGASIDDLVRAADQGAPIGTTQRYFKNPVPRPAPTPAPAPKPEPVQELNKSGESEKEMIDRILGRKKQSMSDAPGELAAGQQYAQAESSDMPKGFSAVTLPPGFYEVKKPEAAKEPEKKEVPRGEGDTVTGPTTPESIAGRVLNPGQPNPRDLVQRIGDAVLPPLVTAPTIAAGGELLPAAPAVGRAVASGLLGGAKAAGQGKGAGGIVWDTVVDGLVAGGAEGASVLASHLKIPFTGMASLKEAGEKVPGAQRGFEGAGTVLEKARDLIASRLPKTASLNVPALSNTPMTLQEAVKALQGLRGDQYQIARQQLIHALNDNDREMIKRGVKPLVRPFSGQMFGKFSPKERFVYTGTPGERAATRVLDFSRSPATRAALDAEATQEVAPGIPAGAMPLLGTESFSELAKHAKPRL